MMMMKAESAEGSAESGANWSELYDDLLHQMSQKVRCLPLSDYIRFGAVCTNWRRIQGTNYADDDDHIKINLPSKLPVLLIPNQTSVSPAVIAAQQQQTALDRHYLRSAHTALGSVIDNGIITRYYNPNDTLWVGEDITRLEKPTRTIYSLYTRKVHTNVQLHVPHYLNCRGSSHGWLVAVREDENFSIRLLNPFRSVNNEIELPPLTTIDAETLLDHVYFGSHQLGKAFVSANPSSVSNPADLVVMVTYQHRRPAFCRPGDESWTWYEGNFIWDCNYLVEDAIYYKGQFYAVCVGGTKVITFDISQFHHNVPPKLTEVAGEPFSDCLSVTSYLVECGGDLLHVRRDIDNDEVDYSTHHTIAFEVFKLILSSPSESDNYSKWVKVNTLDGYSIFLGNNGSMSVLASDYPPRCCKPNCIYFTDDHEDRFVGLPSHGPKDMGVFSLEDGSFEPHYEIDCKTFMMPNAIWIQPML